MQMSELTDDQTKIVQCLYNAWQARPSGIGLHEQELCKQTGLGMNDLVKEVKRLKSRGMVDTRGSDDDPLGHIWLTDFGRVVREGG